MVEYIILVFYASDHTYMRVSDKSGDLKTGSLSALPKHNVFSLFSYELC